MVGGKAGAAGQVPQEPGVHGAGAQAALGGQGRGIGDVLQDPGQFAAGNSGLMPRPVAATTAGSWPAAISAAQASAVRRHCQMDGGADRLAGVRVPDDQRLALVGDGDGVGGLACATMSAMTCLNRGPDVARPIARPSRDADSRWSAGPRRGRGCGRRHRPAAPWCWSCPGRWPGRAWSGLRASARWAAAAMPWGVSPYSVNSQSTEPVGTKPGKPTRSTGTGRWLAVNSATAPPRPPRT